MSSFCPTCQTSLERDTRTRLQRVLYGRVLRCPTCGFQAHDLRLPFHPLLRFVFSRHTRCIQCGNVKVRRLPRRDHIDRMSRHPLSLLCGLAFAPIYHCNPCRLQYRDWRQVRRAEGAEHA